MRSASCRITDLLSGLHKYVPGGTGCFHGTPQRPRAARKLSTTYRMYKYSKWYKELLTQTPDNIYPFDAKRTMIGLAATN